jgi:hypothetical protein
MDFLAMTNTINSEVRMKSWESAYLSEHGSMIGDKKRRMLWQDILPREVLLIQTFIKY